MSTDLRQDPTYGKVVAHLEASHQLPPGLLNAVVSAESSGNWQARNPTSGALGLGQFMPAMVKQYAVNLDDPADQLRGMADYLRDLGDQYKGNWNAAVSHYNGGVHNAQRYVSGTEPTAQHVSPANAATNKGYVERVMGDPGAQVGQVNAKVAALAKQGLSTDQIIGSLLQDPQTADLVRQGREAGADFNTIVRKLGGKLYEPAAAAQDKVANQNYLENLVQGASNAAGDMGHGLQQISASMQGKDELLKQLRAQEAARQQDPARRAVNDSWGGAMGGAAVRSLPYIAAGAATGGAALPMIAGQAAAGALEGAVRPTTRDGERGSNMLESAALGAAVPGVMKGAGLVPGAAARVIHGSEKIAARQTQAAKLAEAGLPVNAASLTPSGRTMSALLDSTSAVEANQAAIDKAITKRVVEGLGIDLEAQLPKRGVNGVPTSEIVNDGMITSDVVKVARERLGADYKTALDFNLTLPASTTKAVAAIAKGAENPLTKGVRQSGEVQQAIQNILEVGAAKTEVHATKLHELVSELKALTQKAGASTGDRHLAGQVVGQVQKALTGQMTAEQRALFENANQRWSNLKAVEAMVLKSGDSGQVSPRELLMSVKSGRFKNQFLVGDAPYQDLAKTVNAAYELDNTHKVAKAVGNALNSTANTGVGVGMFIHPGYAMAGGAAKMGARYGLSKLATTSNPTMVRLLTGVDTKALPGVVKPETRGALKSAIANSLKKDEPTAVAPAAQAPVSTATTPVDLGIQAARAQAAQAAQADMAKTPMKRSLAAAALRRAPAGEQPTSMPDVAPVVAQSGSTVPKPKEIARIINRQTRTSQLSAEQKASWETPDEVIAARQKKETKALIEALQAKKKAKPKK